MKQVGILTLILTALALVLAACGATAPEAEAPVEEAPPEAQPPSEPEAPVEAAQEGPTVFVITPAESEARFLIDEVLAGADNTVVGATNAVEGQVSLDMADPSGAQIGTIRVDLSTLVTDNDFRNRAIREVILQANQPENQFAEFAPTSVTGLPASATVGETYPVQISGTLTVKGTTSDVTFEGTVTPASETRLEGSAAMTAPYEDLGVTILRLPDQVASVDENITLEIDFVALAG